MNLPSQTHDPQFSYLQSRLPAALELLEQMVSINSFTLNAAGVNRLGELTAAAFRPLGFQAEFVPSRYPGYGQHLFLRRTASRANGRPAPSLALISHLDTVFPPEEEQANNFTYQQVGNRLYGPGVVDIKGGTVMMLLVLEGLQAFYPDLLESADWLVCLDASEEQLSDDFTDQVLQRLPSAAQAPRAALIFEGGTPNPAGLSLVTARKGRAGFRVSAYGRSAHAGNYHWQGANAILQLAEVLPQIAALTDYAQHITFNIGVISGGTVVNRVPHFAICEGEMRAFDPVIFQQGVQKLLALDGFSSVSSVDGFPCRVQVELSSQSPPWPPNPQTEALFALWQQAGAELGWQIIPEQRGGLSDGNLIWQQLPTLDGLGPVGGNAHCSERSPDGSKEPEFMELESFVPKAQLNLRGIARWLQSV